MAIVICGLGCIARETKCSYFEKGFSLLRRNKPINIILIWFFICDGGITLYIFIYLHVGTNFYFVSTKILVALWHLKRICFLSSKDKTERWCCFVLLPLQAMLRCESEYFKNIIHISNNYIPSEIRLYIALR